MIGQRPLEGLVDARLQLHWAAQVLARFGDARVEARADYSHSALTWDPGRACLRGELDPSGRRLELHPVDLVLRMSGPGGASAEFGLQGRSLGGAFSWLASLPGEEGRLELGEPDVPFHPVSTGAAFDPDIRDVAELAAWFHEEHTALERVRKVHLSASPV
ncbi:MAG: hypothetical protein E4H28_04185, partial [Gemmatimonadales bacterium]